MSVHPLNPCKKCAEFDLKTKKKMTDDLFSQDEVSLLAILLSQSIYARSSQLKKMGDSDHRRLNAMRDIDFSSQVLGKFMVSFEEEQRKKTLEALRKVGILINVNHEECPHEVKTDAAH